MAAMFFVWNLKTFIQWFLYIWTGEAVTKVHFYTRKINLWSSQINNWFQFVRFQLILISPVFGYQVRLPWRWHDVEKTTIKDEYQQFNWDVKTKYSARFVEGCKFLKPNCWNSKVILSQIHRVVSCFETNILKFLLQIWCKLSPKH